MNNPIIVQGSSRKIGETRKAIEMIIGNRDIQIIDLYSLNITPYDYEQRNNKDDYIPLMEEIIEHDLIILATPVYWNSMSATMKIFIDRVSDLTGFRKDLGRKLRGKKLFVIASFNTSLPKGFEYAFSLSCEYLGIEYQGCSFIYHGNDLKLLENSQEQLKKAKDIIGIDS